MADLRALSAGPFRLEQLDDRRAAEMWLAVEETREALRPYLVWAEGIHSVVDVERFIARARIAAHDGRERILGVSAANAAFVGAIGLYNIDQRNRNAELGFWTRASWMGRGVCTAAAARVVRHAFEDLALHRLFIRHAVDNHASRAVIRKLGFAPEGVAREDTWVDNRWVTHETYGMLIQEYRERAAGLLRLEGVA